MNIDLSSVAGFPLEFNPETLAISPGSEIAFVREARTAQQIKDVLFSPEGINPDEVLFYIDHLENAPRSSKNLLDQYGFTYGFTILPPVRVGREYSKTHGHVHPRITGTDFTYPEIYAQIFGKMWLFLQKSAPNELAILEDCIICEMTAGSAIIIPPGYAHMQINPTTEPSVTAGLYSRNFVPEFDFYKNMHGFAYYILENQPEPEIVRNQNYPSAPPLRWISELQGSQFEVVEPGSPLWTSLNQRPDEYSFLTDPRSIEIKFSRNV